MNPKKDKNFTVKLRIPGWAKNEPVPGNLYEYLETNPESVKILMNGENVESLYNKGYIQISRKWSKGDKIEVLLPMRIQRVIANEKVQENMNHIALEYGPFVYCGEEIDNQCNISDIYMPDNAKMKIEKRNNLLGGVNILTGQVFASDTQKECTIMMIPYYVWSNRGVGKMKVWFPREIDQGK